MTATLDPTARYAPHLEVIESRLGEETVILHLAQGVYFGLDPVATIVWERLQQGEKSEAICDYVRTSFDAVPETLEDEITAFLQELLDKGLIERR